MSAPTFAEFLADPAKIWNDTLELYARDTVSFIDKALYFSSQPFGTLTGETPSAQQFARRIIRGMSRTQGAAAESGGGSGIFTGFVDQDLGATVALRMSFGDLDLGTEPPELNGRPLRHMAFGGRRAVYKIGGRCSAGDLPYSEYRTILDGECEGQPEIGVDTATFKLRGKDHRLSHPAQTRKLYGTHLCAVFNGTDGYIDLGTSDDYDLTTEPRKLEFLIWLEAYPGTESTIYVKGAVNVAGSSVRLSTAGKLKFQTHQSGATQTTTSDALPLKTWVRASLLYDGDETATIYCDGEDATETHGTHLPPASATGNNAYIGRNNAGSIFFAGALDDFRISLTDVDEDTIDQQAFRPLDTFEAARTILYLQFDDGTGSSTVVDSSPSGHDGTISGGVALAPSCMGKADLRGRIMPHLLGAKRGVRPIPVDLTHESGAYYLVHSGSIDGFDAVRVGLSDTALSGPGGLGTAYTNFLTFVTTPAVEGSYDTYIGPYWSLVRIWGQAAYPVTVDGRGDNTGGVYRTGPSELTRFVCTTYGQSPFADPAEVDDASFDALEAETDPECGIWYADERTVREVAEELLSGAGGTTKLWVDDLSGKLMVKRLGDPSLETAVATITAADCVRQTIQPKPALSPYWKVIVFYEECLNTLDPNDVLEEMRGTEIHEFHNYPFRSVDRDRAGVLRRNPDARVLEITMPVNDEAAATAECVRLRALLDKQDQGFTLQARELATEIKLFDVVTLDYQDLDDLEQPQNRFGTPAKFYVVAKRPTPNRAVTEFELWRPEAP